MAEEAGAIAVDDVGLVTIKLLDNQLDLNTLKI